MEIEGGSFNDLVSQNNRIFYDIMGISTFNPLCASIYCSGEGKRGALALVSLLLLLHFISFSHCFICFFVSSWLQISSFTLFTILVRRGSILYRNPPVRKSEFQPPSLQHCIRPT